MTLPALQHEGQGQCRGVRVRVRVRVKPHLVEAPVVDQDAISDLGRHLAVLLASPVPEACQQALVVARPVHLHRHHELRIRELHVSQRS